MSISEAYFYAMHPEEQEEEMQFDCLFLLDLVPTERDWIFELMRSK
jgi:hypothetical protein